MEFYGDETFRREGRTDLQQRYGSNLPPSLRYGAVKRTKPVGELNERPPAFLHKRSGYAERNDFSSGRPNRDYIWRAKSENAARKKRIQRFKGLASRSPSVAPVYIYDDTSPIERKRPTIPYSSRGRSRSRRRWASQDKDDSPIGNPLPERFPNNEAQSTGPNDSQSSLELDDETTNLRHRHPPPHWSQPVETYELVDASTRDHSGRRASGQSAAVKSDRHRSPKNKQDDAEGSWRLNYDPEDKQAWFHARPSHWLNRDDDCYSSSSDESTQASKTRFKALVFETPTKGDVETGPVEPFRRRIRPSISEEKTPDLRCVVEAVYGEAINENSSSLPCPRSLLVFKAGTRPPSDPLYYVLHIQQQTPNFEAYKNAVTGIRELRKIKSELQAHLTKVQSSYENIVPNNNAGRHMDSFVYKTSPETNASFKHSVTSICLPFAALRKLQRSGDTSQERVSLLERLFPRKDTSGSFTTPNDAKMSTEHTVRTLFQSLNPNSDSRRDLKQAICNLQRGADGQCLHVHQLWALIINDELLVTCSVLSEDKLYDGLMEDAVVPADKPRKRITEPRICLQTPDEAMWHLRAADCSTYLDFASYFSDHTSHFAGEFEVFAKEKRIPAHIWRQHLGQEHGSNIDLSVKKKKTSRDSRPEDVLMPDAAELYRRLDCKSFTPYNAVGLWIVKDDCTRFSKRLVQPETLLGLGHSFEEQSEEFVIKERLAIGKVAEIVHLCTTFAPGELEREILSRLKVIAADPLGGPYEELAEKAQPEAIKLDFKELNDHTPVDEQAFFDRFPAVDEVTFHQRLETICSQSETAESRRTSEYEMSESNGLKLTTNVVSLLEILGYVTYPTDEDRRPRKEDGSMELHRRDGSLIATLINGLASFARLTSGSNINLQGEQDEGKLLKAVLTFATMLVKNLHQDTPPESAYILRILHQSLEEVCCFMEELEVYEFTKKQIPQDQSHRWQAMIKHATFALFFSAFAVAELAKTLPLVKMEMDNSSSLKSKPMVPVSRNWKETVSACKSFHCVSDYYSSCASDHDEDESTRFEETVRRIARCGWTENVARAILKNSILWDRVRFYANSTGTKLRKIFNATLSKDPKSSLDSKAVAWPSDILVLMLPRLLHMHVFEGRDAIDMYNRYVTDLETTILTGDPSREPLDRLRILKHELNAFSQIQTQQMDILESMLNVLIPPKSSKSRSELYAFPQPRRVMLNRLISDLEVQNQVIELLNDLVDTLQGEAQAQMSAVEDWRGNAAVVFTVVTVIFLPLSFVASVLGMNTADVRNMDSGQWVFWASAVPFTVVCIVVTLWFVDVPPLRRWIDRKFNTSSS